MTNSEDVYSRLEAERERHLEELKAFLRIPSISTDPEHAGDMERCSRFVEEQLVRAGLEAERVSPGTGANETYDNGGPPLVIGEWLGAPGKPTVLIYGHYDVQPVDPIEEWRSPPFEPTIEGEALVARGTTDDKGQLFCHLKALEAMLAERGELPVNVKVLIEGEEESGGDSVERYLRAHSGRFACDAALISDSIMFPGQPILASGARGMIMLELIARGPKRDLHSGEFGGAVANPLNALTWITGQLVDRETGRITIPGFYDNVLQLSGAELAEIGNLPFDEDAYRSDLGVNALFGEQGRSTLERAATRPTCDIHGIWGGYQGPGSKTVLPAAVGAKLSMRLVPDQDPRRVAGLFRDHVASLDVPGVELEVRELAEAKPWRLDAEGPIVEAAMAAMEDVWGNRPLRARGGGSLPILSTLTELLDIPVLLLGFGLPDDRPHSPNEKLDLPQFYGGIRSSVRILDRIGAVR
ncbi:MAG: dipeptidase [bacterium]|nr:dipeptidase [bacterium]